MQPEGRNRKMESEIGKWKIPEEWACAVD
jgi:hypothetical protein